MPALWPTAPTTRSTDVRGQRSAPRSPTIVTIVVTVGVVVRVAVVAWPIPTPTTPSPAGAAKREDATKAPTDETVTDETWAAEATYVAPEATGTKMAAAKAAHVAATEAATTYMSATTSEAATAMPSKRHGVGRKGGSSERNTRRERDGQSPQPLQHITSPFQRGRNPQTGCRFRQSDQYFFPRGLGSASEAYCPRSDWSGRGRFLLKVNSAREKILPGSPQICGSIS